jgi:hypothetical protein
MGITEDAINQLVKWCEKSNNIFRHQVEATLVITTGGTSVRFAEGRLNMGQFYGPPRFDQNLFTGTLYSGPNREDSLTLTINFSVRPNREVQDLINLVLVGNGELAVYNVNTEDLTLTSESLVSAGMAFSQTGATYNLLLTEAATYVRPVVTGVNSTTIATAA